jgi:hypothetical protein
MRFPKRLRALLAATAAALVAAACDSPSATIPGAPSSPSPSPVGVRMECSADVRAGTVTCNPPRATAGVRANRILGGQGVNVRTVTSGVAVTADTFAFDLSVINQLPAPIGTRDGLVDPEGVRVFFVDGVHTTGGTGSVSVANADGLGTFTATNQPYFAYHQIIAPEQVSAPRRWKLRFDAGVQQFSFSLLVSAEYPKGGASVSLRVGQPASGTTVGDTVVVIAIVDSIEKYKQNGRIQAIVGNTVVSLVSHNGGFPDGKVVLAGLPPGAVTISVRATLSSDTGVASVTVYHATPPAVITVASPLSGTVMRPSMRIDAHCQRCRVLLATVSSPFTSARAAVAQGTTGIHQDVSLAAFEGDHRLVLTLTGIDSANVAVRRKVEVPVESSARLSEIVSGGDRLLGFNATQLLVGTEDLTPPPYTTWYWHVRLRDRATGAETEVGSHYRSVEVVDYRGWRFSTGFAFSPSSYYQNLWVTPSAQNPVAYNNTAEIAGEWLTWLANVNPWNAVRINLQTGVQEEFLPYVDQYTRPQVGENGDVVWSTYTDVYRARVGEATAEIPTTGSVDAPMTDGVNVAYVQVSTTVPLRLKLYTAAGQTLDLGEVAPPFAGYFTPSFERVDFPYRFHTDFELRNGWLAFVRPDAGGLRQVWVRSPAGDVVQATSVGSHAEIRAVGRNGELIFASGGSVYSVHYPYTAAPVRLFSDIPFYFLRWEGDQLLLFLGRTAFDVSY